MSFDNPDDWKNFDKEDPDIETTREFQDKCFEYIKDYHPYTILSGRLVSPNQIERVNSYSSWVSGYPDHYRRVNGYAVSNASYEVWDNFDGERFGFEIYVGED